MDSTAFLPQLQPIAPSASKLPIKRKSPFSPQLGDASSTKPRPRLPPSKFHRVWTEPDEITFLQGLLQSQEQGLSFPKDLPIFYSNFSSSISQPYTKSQLSEKLRRLRKKFRVVSSRLARGLSPSALSSHDQTLFDLSRRLWSPEFSSTSPFGNNGIGNDFEDGDMVDNYGGVKINEVNVNFDFGGVICGEGIRGVLAKSVLNVFDECFKEAQIKMGFAKQGVVLMDPMERRWKEQRVSELDAFGRRLRLVIEDSLAR